VLGNRSARYVDGHGLLEAEKLFQQIPLAVAQGPADFDGDDVPLAHDGHRVAVLRFQGEARFESVARRAHVQLCTQKCPKLRGGGGRNIERIRGRDRGQAANADRHECGEREKTTHHLTRAARWKRRATSLPK
jgi:hypothetical protein